MTKSSKSKKNSHGGKRKGAGRKRISANGRLRKTISVTDECWADWEQKASAASMSVSEWLRTR